MLPENITCIDLNGIIDATEGENVFEVNTGDWECLGLASRRKNELVVVDELFAPFQNYLLSNGVDRGDGLMI